MLGPNGDFVSGLLTRSHEALTSFAVKWPKPFCHSTSWRSLYVYVGNFVRLQCRQDLAREATDLVHEHLVWHRPTIETDRHLIRSGMIGSADDTFGDLVRPAPRQLLGVLADAVHREAAVPLAI